MPSSLQSKWLAQVKPATHNATAPIAMIAAAYRRAVTESTDEYRQRFVPPLPRRSSLKRHFRTLAQATVSPLRMSLAA